MFETSMIVVVVVAIIKGRSVSYVASIILLLVVVVMPPSTVEGSMNRLSVASWRGGGGMWRCLQPRCTQIRQKREAEGHRTIARKTPWIRSQTSRSPGGLDIKNVHVKVYDATKSIEREREREVSFSSDNIIHQKARQRMKYSSSFAHPVLLPPSPTRPFPPPSPNRARRVVLLHSLGSIHAGGST